jgi:hypothetical protein
VIEQRPKKPHTGGTAFPFADVTKGMTLRDYFAAKAMQGLYASSYSAESYATISEMAYNQADSMLKAREL